MNVLVTGGTGFLGTALVKKLVEEKHHVYVIARSEKKADALIEMVRMDQRKLVHIIMGDLSEKNLGISELVMGGLVGNINAVYHTAAYLSFDEKDRVKLFEVNVEGTKEALSLSKVLGVKKFVHVSTAYTLGNSNMGYEHLYPLDTTTFVNSYEESKCHAEHLVMSYNNVFDVMIMRPSIIIGDSETGEADTTFGLYGILRGMELLKKKNERLKQSHETSYRFLVDKSSSSNIVPVDYIVRILTAGIIHGKKNTIYNLVNPSPPSNQRIMEIIKEGLEFDAVELIPMDQIDLLTDVELKVNEQIFVVFKNYLHRSIEFCNDNTRELLKMVNEPLLQMDNKMLFRIVEGFYNRRSFVMK